MRYQIMIGCLVLAGSWLLLSSTVNAQETVRAQASDAAEPYHAVARDDSATAPAEPRSLAALTKDTRAALRAEATLTEPASWGTAVRALVALNDELRVHPKNRPGTSFERLKRSVRRRLLKAQKKLNRVAKRKGGEAAPDQPEKIDAAVPTQLAQQVGGIRPAGGAGIGGGAGFGGAAGGFAGGPAALGDYGEDLVELIESTINADIWQTVGGPAAIIYYQPSQALIISAPADVHERVSDLLRQLRAAGGL